MGEFVLSDEEIQKELAGDALRGPRVWRGRTLAELTRGLRDLVHKVVAVDDTGIFHDVAVLQILAEAYAEKDSERLEKRRALLVATDDVAGFRASISLVMDDLDEEALREARRLTNQILGIVELAEVGIAEKKSGPESAAPSPTVTPSTLPRSPKKPGGRRNTSAGS